MAAFPLRLQQLIDAEGRSCIHVRITQDGKGGR